MKKEVDRKGNFGHSAADISKYRLLLGNAHCYRLLMFISKDVYKKDDVIKLEYDFNELCEAIGIGNYRAFEARKKLKQTLTLMKKPICYSREYVNGSGQKDLDWVEDQLLYKDKKDGDKVTILISETCMNILSCLDGYTPISLALLNKLESNQQSYLYLLLKSYARFHKGKRVFSLKEFLTIMNADTLKSYDKEQDSNYLANIKRRLIGVTGSGEYTTDKAGNPFGTLYQINKNTDIDVSVDFEKDKLGEYFIIFNIKEKESKDDEDYVIQFNKMVSMIQEAVNPSVFNSYFKDISILRYDSKTNSVFFGIPSQKYMTELEKNVIAFSFLKTAFFETFGRLYPGIKLVYEIR